MQSELRERPAVYPAFALRATRGSSSLEDQTSSFSMDDVDVWRYAAVCCMPETTTTTIKLCPVVFRVTLRFLVVNTSLTSTPNDAKYWLRIAIFAYPHAFDTLIRECPHRPLCLVWLPNGEHFLRCIRIDRIYERY